MSCAPQPSPTKTVPVLGLSPIPAPFLMLQGRRAVLTLTGHLSAGFMDIKSQSGQGCHPCQKQGKLVRIVVATGCRRCHRATSEKVTEKTTITFQPHGGGLSAMCHDVKQKVVVRQPDQTGRFRTFQDLRTGKAEHLLRAASGARGATKDLPGTSLFGGRQ